MKKSIYLLMFSLVTTLSFANDLWVKKEVVGSYLFEKIQFLDSLVGFASGQTNLLKTTDGGKTWEEKIMVDFMGNAINNVEMFPDGYGFMMRSQNIYQTSTDFGETWTDHPVPGNHIYNIFYALDHNRIWIGDIAARTIIYTKNGGTTWDSLKLDNYNTFNYIYKCYFFNDDKGLIFTNSGVILKTTNSGQNWTEIEQVLDSNLYSFSFIDENNGWLGGAKGSLYRTTDGGDKWNKINSPSDNDITNIYFFDEKEGFVSTMKQITGYTYTGDIYYTNDGGATWQLQYHVPNYYVSSFSFLSKNSGWAATYTNVLLKYDNTTSVDKDISEQIEKRTVFLFSDKKVYPLPASSNVSASIYWNEQYYLIENAKIRVYTSYGEEISNPNISIEKLASYKANIIWDCSDYASGIYFINVSLGDENISIPVIVMR